MDLASTRQEITCMLSLVAGVTIQTGFIVGIKSILECGYMYVLGLDYMQVISLTNFCSEKKVGAISSE